MVTDLVQGIATASHAISLAKTLMDTNKSVDVNAVAIELQQIILNLQAELQKSQQVQHELEAEIARRDDWNKTKQQYELKAVPDNPSTLLFAHKSMDHATLPDHWACPKCFDNNKRSILQGIQSGPLRRIEYKTCLECGSNYEMTIQKPPPPVSRKKSDYWG